MGNPSVTRDQIVLLLVNGMSAEAAEVFAIQSGAEVEGGAISFRRLVQLVQGREKGREKVSPRKGVAEKRCQDDFIAVGKSSRHLFRSDIFPLSTARGDLLVVMIWLRSSVFGVLKDTLRGFNAGRGEEKRCAARGGNGGRCRGRRTGELALPLAESSE